MKEMLEKLIKVSGEGLTTDKKQSIRDCAELECGEVGETMYEIDTGDSPPIRQPPNHSIFGRRSPRW